MKLKLAQISDIQVLDVDGPISTHHVQVLRAGITKIFTSGKNRIILDLSKSANLENDVIRELAVLNIMASELSGAILLAGVNAEIQKKINSFAKPPVIRSFETLEAAAKHFKSLQTNSAENAKVPAAAAAEVPAASKDELPADVAKLQEEVLSLRDQLHKKEVSELAELRKLNEHLTQKNKTIEAQFAHFLIERRDPPDAASFQEQSKSYESQIQELLVKLKEFEK